ncbi:hypothetical protein [uncultured Clostridium sp.]|uniref:hypothetical protein n=1 Tax=uncultured Clostridium sp. TaxID=59620 RepID=UPI0025E6C40F|nr:hypothetical protein [uncultured Clostridium sp.]
MLPWNEMNFTNKIKDTAGEIIKWNNSGGQILNVISPPYNSTRIFMDIINAYTRQNKDVLYVTEEEPSNVDIINNIKKYTDFKGYTYVKDGKNNANCLFKVCNFCNALKLREKFQLIIYDDINSFPLHGKYEVIDLIHRLMCGHGKAIVYSIENISGNGEELFFPLAEGGPIVEPRTVLTRFDMNRDIPFVVYDYLKWSLSKNAGVVIYVPDKLKITNVYSYIYNYCRNLCKNIVCSINREEFYPMKNSILITDSFDEVISCGKNSNVMVYFADNTSFDYKKFVYLCGNVKRGGENSKGEVIMVANLKTEDMRKAKDITSNFNREAWDMDLLKI